MARGHPLCVPLHRWYFYPGWIDRQKAAFTEATCPPFISSMTLEAATFLTSVISPPIERSFICTFLLASLLLKDSRLVGLREQTSHPIGAA